jgi:GT2 family glycosyltransferase
MSANFPVISIVVPVFNINRKYLEACIESVRNQTDSNWELILSDDASTKQETLDCLNAYRGIDARIRVIRNSKNLGIAEATNKAIEFSTGQFIGFLDNDDTLDENAIFEVRACLARDPEIDFIYSDEDKINPDGAYCDTYFKPDWSPEHLLSCMYILHFTVISKFLLEKVGFLRAEFDGAQDYDLALQATAIATKIHHIPKILYHWRKIPGSAAELVDAKPTALINAGRCVGSFTQKVVDEGLLPGFFRVRHEVNTSDMVTVVILTNGSYRDVDGKGRINLLLNCLKSIDDKTTYKNLKILVVDDGELPKDILEKIKDIKRDIQIVHYQKPDGPFNYARKFNFAWPLCGAEKIISLNDDIEVITPDWIESLCEQMWSDEVGIVGAKLYHANNTIQHAGVVLGVNNGAAHIYHGYPRDFIGYNGFTHLVRNYSAVTAACLLTKKSLLEKVGGFDEIFAIDYNDIDFCLKVREKGLRIVFTPFCELYHFESSSIKRVAASDLETHLFKERWAKYLENDPYYNPNLPKHRHDYIF